MRLRIAVESTRSVKRTVMVAAPGWSPVTAWILREPACPLSPERTGNPTERRDADPKRDLPARHDRGLSRRYAAAVTKPITFTFDLEDHRPASASWPAHYPELTERML